jgi:cell wall-associated NlpC family hydrolase
MARRKRAVAGGLLLLLAACTTTPSNRPEALAAQVPTAIPAAGPAASQSTAAQFVSGARAMIGEPYRYGGAAPGGFDCSGLVVYAAAGAGLVLPRTAQEQLRAGSPIARREVRGGDLVFMHLAAKELHVGIAIDAERFVHAPSSGGRVRIDSLDRAPYARGFLEARRVADDTAPYLR